jgi:hypothetical protein
LTIDSEELGNSCCPECLERSGKQRYEFDELEMMNDGVATYRCEDCGAIVKIP